MKRVLITGKDSYIGESFRKYVAEHYPSDIEVDSISVRGDEWRSYDFSRYDTVLHVAALVHKNEKNIALDEYLKVNNDLTIAVANKARLSGVKQFVFMSTIAVYEKTNFINDKTKLNPTSKYGISKLMAESSLLKMRSSKFVVTIVRPPMIYGKNSPGNFSRLRALALKFPIFPKFDNRRSMVFVDNLSEALVEICVLPENIIIIPQNKEYVSTSSIIYQIRSNNGEQTVFISGVKNLLRLLISHNRTLDKVYGSLAVDRKLSGNLTSYAKINLVDSIDKIEEKIL